MSSDQIQLRGLRLLCLCGALPEEQERRQPYEVDVDIVSDFTAATLDDELDHTIDYGAVLERLQKVADAETFQLFERMAQRLADAVLEDARIDGVTIEIRKMRPPVPHELGSSGVRITRRQT